MKHPSQIFTSRTYKVLESFEEMKGKTVVGVFHVADLTMLVNTGTILILGDEGSVVTKDELIDTDFDALEDFTEITRDQLI